MCICKFIALAVAHRTNLALAVAHRSNFALRTFALQDLVKYGVWNFAC